LVLGIYWFMLERPEAREQGQLRKRLRAASAPALGKRIDFVKQAEKLSAVKSLDVALAHTRGVATSLQRLITQADVQMTVGGLVLASACLFFGGWLIVGRLTRLPWFGLAIGLLLSYVPYRVVRFKANKRLRTFEEQFPEAIELIGRALRAGHAFT